MQKERKYSFTINSALKLLTLKEKKTIQSRIKQDINTQDPIPF